MPRPADKRGTEELVDDVASYYLKFAEYVEDAGGVDKLDLMRLVRSIDELNGMKKDLSKLVKALEAQMKLKIIEMEVMGNEKDSNEQSKSGRRIKLPVKPEGE